MITHFLVTRFNLRVNTWDTTKNGQKVLTEEWMFDRFRLFEQFCLPSVKNQSDQDFTWCIYFDANTQDPFLKRIDAIAKSFTNIRPFFVNGIAEMIESFQDFTKDRNNPGRYIITTRLDNDDILHRDFIKTIKAAASSGPRAIIDLRKGLQLCIESKHAELRAVENSFNPFISLVEVAATPETVISKKHRDWEKVTKTVVVGDKPLWIELVHQTNKLNAVNGRSKKLTQNNFTEFGLDNSRIRLEPKWKIRTQNFGLQTNSFLSRFANLFQ
jgi:hypothetical protein